jgi:putative transposase
VRVYRKKRAEDEPPLQLSERARLRELEREVRELRMKADFLSKPRRTSRRLRAGASVSDMYEFIDVEYATCENAPALTHMCAWLEVSKSGFYEWKSRSLIQNPSSRVPGRRLTCGDAMGAQSFE